MGSAADVSRIDWNLFGALGFNVDDALQYCDNDKEFYVTLLVQYIEEQPPKLEKIKEAYAAGNWEDYCTLIHSVKSSSKMIGAVNLFEHAYALEKASSNSDENFINLNHDKVMNECNNICRRISALIHYVK